MAQGSGPVSTPWLSYGFAGGCGLVERAAGCGHLRQGLHRQRARTAVLLPARAHAPPGARQLRWALAWGSAAGRLRVPSAAWHSHTPRVEAPAPLPLRHMPAAGARQPRSLALPRRCQPAATAADKPSSFFSRRPRLPQTPPPQPAPPLPPKPRPLARRPTHAGPLRRHGL